ncbi:hypothetical protein SAMN05444172_1612 [Burkholderia sp. GAS332]|nr:hypothetical protein SAMN05444172_1612 [Burkholderia sp. GAS332]
MKTRMQFCPVCQKQTSHTYDPLSVPVALFLCLCWLLPGLLYIWWAVRRADRTARCSVDHAALQRERDDERVRLMVQAMQGGSGKIEPPRRGTGFMSH